MVENTMRTVYLGQSMGNSEHQDETLLHRQRGEFLSTWGPTGRWIFRNKPESIDQRRCQTKPNMVTLPWWGEKKCWINNYLTYYNCSKVLCSLFFHHNITLLNQITTMQSLNIRCLEMCLSHQVKYTRYINYHNLFISSR